jgi:hypothetical protein
VDKAGNLHAVDFGRDRGAVGRVDGASGACAAAPAAAVPSAILNGLRVLPDGSLLAAVTDQKRVVRLQVGGRVTQFCADKAMVAPNDLAISPKTGFVYISGQAYNPDTKAGDGDVWLCRKAGAAAVRCVGRGRGRAASHSNIWRAATAGLEMKRSRPGRAFHLA